VKTYGYAIAALICIIVGWGLVAPKLVSAANDLLVAMGFAVMIAVPVMVYGIFKTWAETDEGKKLLEKLKGE
jgi:hypothetical protein